MSKLTFRNIDGHAVPYNTQTTEFMKRQVGLFHMKQVSTDVGSMKMRGLWAIWMDECSQYFRNQGVKIPHYVKPDGTPVGSRAFNEKDCHSWATARFVGQTEDGEPLSWAMDEDGGVTVATKEQRLLGMQKFVQFCTELAISLSMPEDSEYQKYIDAQER